MKFVLICSDCNSIVRLMTEVQKNVAASDVGDSTPDDVWDDFASDFWKTSLPHFRQRGFVYCAGPVSALVPHTGSPELTSSYELLNELIHYNSETNLLAALEDQSTLAIHDASSSMHVSAQDKNPLEEPSGQGEAKECHTAMPLLYLDNIYRYDTMTKSKNIFAPIMW